MKSLFLSAGLVVLLCGAAAAQNRPAGWQTTGCNPDMFTPVMTSDGNVGYWTNPTCPASAGGGNVIAALPQPVQGGDEPPTQDDGPIDDDGPSDLPGDLPVEPGQPDIQ